MPESHGGFNERLSTDISLGKQRQYRIDFEFEGRRGTFVFHRPSLKERLAIGVMEANLIGNMSRQCIDLASQNIARFMSTFSTLMDESPEWFDLDTIDDYELLESLYEKYFEVVKPFRGGWRKRDKGNSGAGGASGGENKVGDNERVRGIAD